MKVLYVIGVAITVLLGCTRVNHVNDELLENNVSFCMMEISELFQMIEECTIGKESLIQINQFNNQLFTYANKIMQQEETNLLVERKELKDLVKEINNQNKIPLELNTLSYLNDSDYNEKVLNGTDNMIKMYLLGEIRLLLHDFTVTSCLKSNNSAFYTPPILKVMNKK